MSTETVVVTSTCASHAEQISMRIDSVHDGANGSEEHGILVRVLARIEQVALAVRKAPVVVLARTIHACKRLFVQQTNETVAVRHIAERFHHEHIVVASEVHFFKKRSKFELSRSHFVVACLCRDAKLPQFLFHIVHKVQDAARNAAKVMVIHLLVLCRSCTENRAASLVQVRSLQIKSLVDEEVFLFSAERNSRLLRTSLKASHEAASRLGKRLQAAEERSLLVESFTRVATECRRDAESCTIAVTLDERRRSRVPSGIAASLECGTETAAREARSVRFAHNQILTAESHNGLATRRFNKTVVLFGRRPRQRLEPMRKVRRAAIHCPALHSVSDIASDARVKSDTFVNRCEKLFANVLREVGAHGIGIENVFAIEIDIRRSGRHHSAHRRRSDIVDGLITTIVHFLPYSIKVSVQPSLLLVIPDLFGDLHLVF